MSFKFAAARVTWPTDTPAGRGGTRRQGALTMYSNFFGLRSLPFEGRADTQFFYPTAECEETLAAMEHEIHHSTGLRLLIGEAGTGKTLLLRTLLRRLQKSDQPVVLTWPASGATDLVRECCKGFGVSLPSSQNQSHSLNRLCRHLNRSAGAGIRSILLVDQAENFSTSNIAQLATLAELYGDCGKLLTIILAAQPLVRSLLDRPEFARIRQQLFGERTLSPFTPTETGDYIRHRLQIAGAGDAPLFDDQAMSLIHAVTDGIPRLINHVCNAAMLAAYSAQMPRITRAIVEEATARHAVRERTVAARDLGLAMTGESSAPWLNISNAPMASNPFDSPMTPTYIMLDEEAEEAWSATNRTSGASIVDGEYEGSNSEYSGSGPNKGTFLLARLERATARAQRMTSTTEETLIRLAAVEKQLAAAREDCQAAAQRLNAAIVSADQIHDAIQGLVAHADEKVDRFASHQVAAGNVLDRLCAANVTGHQVVKESVTQKHTTEARRRFSLAPEPFDRISAEATGGQLQVLSEPVIDAIPGESRAANPPSHTEEIVRLLEEAMLQDAPAPL